MPHFAGRIELLGRIAVHGPKQPASGSLSGRRAELVFAYLAAEHHRVVTADELADALWPDSLPDTWSAGLRGVVTEVRRFLEDAGLEPAEVLVTARRGYQFELPAGMSIDLDEARESLASAGSALESGAGAEAAAHAARSAELARLPFLASHDGQWVDGIRRDLQAVYAKALDVGARGLQAAGDLAGAASIAEQLVRVEPFSEAGHQLRIRVLGEAGDRAGAIRAYEQCRMALADELGVDPSAETKAALQEAMHAVASPTPAVAPASTATTPTGLPGDLSVLVIEDHDFQRRTAVRVLHGLGVATVAEAANGAAALDLLSGSQQPDVIICDIDMPHMDGIEFIARVAERGLASAVVVASGLDSKVLAAVQSIGEAHGLQLLGAIEKPLTGRRLGELLGTYRRHPVPPAAGQSVSGAEVATALATGGLSVVFEPIADLGEYRIWGAEAVGRVSRPAGDAVVTGAVLRTLAAGDLQGYTEVVVAGAGSGAAVCRSAGRPIAIGVDVSTAVLAGASAADRIRDLVAGAGADPGDVTFEVAERSLADAPQVALDALTRLRVKGFGLALDRVGARGAPADRLARVPFTLVKVDANLVAGAGGDRQRVALLEETLDRSRSLAPVVACGCESEQDFDLVAEMGFRYAQGPFLGPPMGAAELADWAGSWTPQMTLPGPG